MGGPACVKGGLRPAGRTGRLLMRESTCSSSVIMEGGGSHGLQTGLEQLPALVSAVGDQVDLVLDGGVRRGSDIIKAICLGAKACMIGRAWVFGLSYGGTPGVEAVIQVLEREMDMVLGLLGVSSIRRAGCLVRHARPVRRRRAPGRGAGPCGGNQPMTIADAIRAVGCPDPEPVRHGGHRQAQGVALVTCPVPRQLRRRSSDGPGGVRRWRT